MVGGSWVQWVLGAAHAVSLCCRWWRSSSSRAAAAPAASLGAIVEPFARCPGAGWQASEGLVA
jgi:hypothetical protein